MFGEDDIGKEYLCRRHGSLEKRFEKVLRKVDEKIRSLKRKFKPQKVNQVLKREDVVEYLENLHKNFVLVPIDKAGNNIAIICKRYYVEVILKEIGEIETGNDTYQKIEKNVSEIVEENVMYSKHLGLEVEETEKDLPSMYWIPKMHKDPPSARFIIASKQCSTKKNSKAVSSA